MSAIFILAVILPRLHGCPIPNSFYFGRSELSNINIISVDTIIITNDNFKRNLDTEDKLNKELDSKGKHDEELLEIVDVILAVSEDDKILKNLEDEVNLNPEAKTNEDIPDVFLKRMHNIDGIVNENEEKEASTDNVLISTLDDQTTKSKPHQKQEKEKGEVGSVS